jgi:hypothetical protein
MNSPAFHTAPSCRPQLALPSNAFVPLVQMSDLIFGLAILSVVGVAEDLVVEVTTKTTR